MPQFDIGSFFNQVVFFFTFFFFCYFLTTYFFVPFICKSLKFRKKKITSLQTYFIGIQIENWKQQLFLNRKIYQVVNNFQTTFHNTWNQVTTEIVPIQREALNKMNLKDPYLKFNTQCYVYPRYFQ